MATDLELAVLSSAACMGGDINAVLIPSWTPDEDLVRDLPSGRAAQVLEKGNEVVITFRGADDPKLNDFYNGDSPVGSGYYPDQVWEAIRLVASPGAVAPSQCHERLVDRQCLIS